MILFTSQRPLERAENIKAVYDAYDGEKAFARMDPYRQIPDLNSGKYELQVTDELPSATVGKCLFIGHGMGAGKTYGLDQPHRYFNRPDLITCAIASSEDIVPLVANQCGISESQVIPIGMPRTDAYFKKKRKKSGRRNYLYAPTFRGYGGWSPDWDVLQHWLNDDEDFIVKPHVVTKHLLPEPMKNIVEYDSGIPSTDFLVQADVLVTDFSSIMFDAYVMRKPVVLYAKDRYRYLSSRGMYRTYPAMYSDCFCDNEKDLAQNLRQVQWTKHMEALREHHAGACDGHSVERCIDLIRSMI